MAETRDNNDKTDDASTEAKNCCCCNCKSSDTSSDEYYEIMQNRISYYQVLLDHSISSSRDIDKQISALSTLGIGLIAVLTQDYYSTFVTIYSLAGYSFFLVAIIFALFSINKAPAFLNKRIDEQEKPEEVKESEIDKIQQSLNAESRLQKIFFSLGIISTILLVLTLQGFGTSLLTSICNLQ